MDAHLTARARQVPVRFSIATFVSAVIVGAVLLTVNPYGIWTKFDGAGRDIFMNVVSSSYPHARRPKTAVILATDHTLAVSQTTWPLPFEAHAIAVETACAAGARAVLLDFVFIDDRNALVWVNSTVRGTGSTLAGR